MANREVSSNLTLSFQANITNTLDNGSVSAAQILATLFQGTIQNGVGEGQANRAWASEDRALAAGANETLDLYQMSNIDIGAGAGNDGLGQACLFEEAILIAIKHESGSGYLQVEPGTTNPITALGSHTVANGGALSEGGVRVFFEPGDVGFNLAAGTKNVKFSAVGGDLTYSVYVLGRHDDDESSSTSSLSSTSSSSLSSSTSSASSSSST